MKQTASLKKYTPNIQTRPQKNVNLQVDVPLLMVTVTLIAIGMVIMFSASADVSTQMERSITYLLFRQFMFLLVGVASAVLFYLWDYRIWREHIVKVYFLICVALLIVLVFGSLVLGSRRSLLNGSLMPSEPAKLITIAYLSLWLTAKRGKLDDFWEGFFPYLIILGIVSGLIIFQPDISAAFTIIMMGVFLYYLAGGKFQYILGIGGIGAVVIWVASLFSDRAALLLDTYFRGFVDPTQAVDHVRIAETAIIRAGFWGAGLGHGSIKYTIPLPHNDSVFAVAAQELGLVGASFIILLFIILVWRGIVISYHAPDLLGSLMAAGISLWIGVEAFMNIAVMIGLMPFTGNALPFFSTGGSNLVVSVTAVGILLGISRVEKTQEERTTHAVVGMRRRDRRRSVSRSSRVTDAGRYSD